MSQNTSSNEQRRKKPPPAKNLDEKSIIKAFSADINKPKDLQTDFKPLFYLVDDIVNRAIQNVDSSAMVTRAYMEDKKNKQEVIRLRERFSSKLDQISYTIAYNTSSGEDAHNTAVSIVKRILLGYPLEAQLLLTLTAFALNYGECWRLSLICSSNQLAKSMSVLKQVADVHEISASLSAPPLEAVNDLVKAMMDVTRCIIEFQQMGEQLGTSQACKVKEYTQGLRQINISLYWVIRGALASASQITTLTSVGFSYVISSTDKDDLIFFTEQLIQNKTELKDKQKLCQPIIEKEIMNKRLGVIKSLLEHPQSDNMNILRAILHYKDDQKPLVDGSDKEVDLDVLRKKQVLLLISDLDAPQEDIDILREIYNKSKRSRNFGQIEEENQFEIVWLPIVGPPYSSEYVNKMFKDKRKAMPWYTVNQPSMIAQVVVKLAKEEWHFDKEPVVVVIDLQGQVACPNALFMMRIWRNLDFPFTIGAQETLWKGKNWNLELLLEDCASNEQIVQWTREENCICLYGGEDMEWIKMFTSRAPCVAKAAGFSLEMIYVGKREPSEQIQRHIETINNEGFSRSLTKENQRLFWSRIVNMGHSRMQLGNTIYEDPIMQEIISLLNLDANVGVWAAFSGKSNVMVEGNGKDILESLIYFAEWKGTVETKAGFISALEDSLLAHQGQIDVIKHIESYEKLVSQFETTHQMDSMKVIKAMIAGKNNSQPLVHGGTKKRVSIDLLRRKKFLLLISDLNIEEMEILLKIHNDIRESSYAIIWLPITDPATMRSDKGQKDFIELQGRMPWYSVHHPSLIDRAAVKFIKEVWGFDQKTMLVMLDHQGRVSCPNVLHYVWKWDTSLSILKTPKDSNPWKDHMSTNFKLELLFEGLDSPVSNWIENGKLVCLYGGEDMEWIRKFTKTTKKVAESARVSMEMMYVGRSNPNERVLRNIENISSENIASHFFNELNLIALFWYRIESMCNSRYELGKTMEKDQIMQELITLLSFDRTDDGGWALICEEATGIAKARGSDFLNCLLDYSEWKKDASEKGFFHALKENLAKRSLQEECYQLVLPDSVENILASAVCLQCQCPLERSIAFKCCGY